MPLDRSNTLRFPVRTKSLFPLPKMAHLDKTYEDICNERALELLSRADNLDVPMYVFWSGGIDSTCVLVSLMKHASKAQRERITVLMSEASCNEYPDFYLRYIRGQFRRMPAAQFPYLLGTKNLIVSGEHNDQLFGSDVIAVAIKIFGFRAVMGPYDPKLFVNFFTQRMGNMVFAIHYVRLFERLMESAPVRLRTNFDLFWWINFAIKWQHVYMRMLSYVTPSRVDALTPEYVKDYYAPFFCTDAFQLWSMNNLDKRVRRSWRSYKYPAKEVIFDFTHDSVYRDNKIKLGSLQYLIVQRIPAAFTDDKFDFHTDVAPEVFYNEHNDLV